MCNVVFNTIIDKFAIAAQVHNKYTFYAAQENKLVIENKDFYEEGQEKTSRLKTILTKNQEQNQMKSRPRKTHKTNKTNKNALNREQEHK